MNEHRAIQGEREVEQLSQLLAWAFGMSAEGYPSWLEKAGLEHVRVGVTTRPMGKVVSGLVQIPMGQWFGGRAIPCLGIAGVGVSPEARGQGEGKQLMLATLREARERSIPLSCLYPSTLSLYRSVGYELAGSRFCYRLRCTDIDVSDRSALVRPSTDQDWGQLRSVYERAARSQDGYLDRGEYIWRRVRQRADQSIKCYVVETDKGIDGYVFVFQERTTGARYNLRLTDFISLNHQAARCLWSFLHDHRSLTDDVIWFSGPADGPSCVLPEARFTQTLKDRWVLRLTHVERALASRGYPVTSQGKLELLVDDPLLPENAGRYTLEVDRGQAEVRREGRGLLRVSARGLASLYSGFASPCSLRDRGLLEGDHRSLDLALGLFAGPAPGMCDDF